MVGDIGDTSLSPSAIERPTRFLDGIGAPDAIPDGRSNVAHGSTIGVQAIGAGPCMLLR
jgi:hypothetical protein